jgi:hypothetical protein
MKPGRPTVPVLTLPIDITPCLYLLTSYLTGSSIAFFIRGFSCSNLLGLRTRLAVASRPL